MWKEKYLMWLYDLSTFLFYTQVIICTIMCLIRDRFSKAPWSSTVWPPLNTGIISVGICLYGRGSSGHMVRQHGYNAAGTSDNTVFYPDVRHWHSAGLSISTLGSTLDVRIWRQ